MSSIKHRALTSVGLLAVLSACAVNACTKSDSGDDDNGGASSGGTGGAPAAGSAGRNAGDAGETGNGGTSSGGSGVAGSSSGGSSSGGSDAGASGAEEAGAPSGGTANAGTGGTGTAGTGGHAGSGTGGTGTGGTAGHAGSAGSGGTAGSGGACTANLQTDKNNCGRCGKTCAGGDCSGGECTPVVVLDPKTDANGLTTKSFLSGVNVYEWEKADDAALDPDLRYRSLRASITPTAPASAGTIIADIPNAAPFVGAVTFDATNLYQCSSAGVTKVALSATAATPTAFFKAPTVTGGFDCGNIAVSATAAFVTNNDITNGKQTIYSILLAAATAATAPTLVPNIGARDTPVTNLSVIGTQLFWLENDLAGSSQPRLMSAPVAGLAAGAMPKIVDTDLGAGTTGPMLATDGTYLYWTVNFGLIGEVRRAPLTTLVPAATSVATDVDTFKGLVVSGQYVYFMEGQSREVFRVKSDGSSAQEPLGTAFIDDTNGQHLGYAITGVDANFVYFLLDDGLIARLPNAP